MAVETFPGRQFRYAPMFKAALVRANPLPHIRALHDLPVGEYFLLLTMLYISLFYFGFRVEDLPLRDYWPTLFLPIIFLATLQPGTIQRFRLTDVALFVGALVALLLTWFFSPEDFGRGLGAWAILLLGVTLTERPVTPSYDFRLLNYVLILGIVAWDLLHLRYVGRIVLRVGDPNGSALVMMLFFFYCRKNAFFLGECLSVAAIPMFQSRNYLLSLSIFYILTVFRKPISRYLTRLSMDSFVRLVGVSVFCVLIISFTFMQIAALFGGVLPGYGPGLKMFHLLDRSNLGRFEANTFLIGHWLEVPLDFLLGNGIHADEICRSNGVYASHNTFLKLTMRYGALYTGIYLLVLGRSIDRKRSVDNWPYVLTFLVFSTFVHATLAGLSLVFFLIILAMPQQPHPSLRDRLRAAAAWRVPNQYRRLFSNRR